LQLSKHQYLDHKIKTLLVAILNMMSKGIMIVL
jgi:hypothetical protein